ncbi:restriction endonuclease [Pinirhizobacter soli]|uniref:restriction endonuclease n=1 Tax=Pinirhizobacter soli TaxID=2786953 RepID=UPI00202A251E|nr:restriction endonuclease [Pinirhizobacter soli]
MGIYPQGRKIQHRYADELAGVDWAAFERLFAEHYRQLGYRVEHSGTGASHARYDGGIDIKLYRDDEYIVVQCKHWNALQVTHNYVHELIGVMHTQHASGAILITSGEFSKAALEAAAQCPAMTLIDGAEVRRIFEISLPTLVPAPPLLPEVPFPLVRGAARPRHRASSDFDPMIIAGSIVAAVLVLALAYMGLQDTPESPGRLAREAHPVAMPRPADVVATAGALAADALDAQARNTYKAMRLPDFRRPVDHEAARAALRNLPGVGTTTWIDSQNLLVLVSGQELRSNRMIDDVCMALDPLGDTMGVVVNVQDVMAKTSEGADVLSRNCKLQGDERAMFQTKRQVNALDPALRAAMKAQQ